MKIQRVTFRNFGSYGNKTMTVEIPEKPSLTLVHGKNGFGKSTLSDVIKFAIFGKLENKKLKDMPNRLNKNAYVKIELLTSKGTVTIERGIEPGFFNLWINGSPVDKAGKRSVQEFLEDEVLEMPFYVFSNTLSLSINDFKSFLKMSNHDKKAIIDRIFGLQVLNQMRELLKSQTKKLRDVVDDLSTSITAFTSSLEASQRELESLEERVKESNVEKGEKLHAEKALQEAALAKHTLNLKKVNEKLSLAQDARRSLNESVGGDRQLIRNIQEKVDLYRNSQCPTCQSSLETDFHKGLLDEYTKSLLEAHNRSEEKEGKLVKINETLSKLERMRMDLRGAISSAQVKISNAEYEIENLETGNVEEQTGSLRKMIDEFSSKITERRNDQVRNQKAMAFYGLTEEILGEKGVKQMAIRSILPALNTEISRLIKILGVDHRISFNEEFDARITHFGVEVSHDTLSTGEMKKVDFAVLLAVIRMMKMKYPFVNMLFLDEIFSSIDADGQYHILKILRQIVKDYDLNIFVISHYPLSHTEFDYRMEIVKTNGFSTFQIEQIS